MLKQQFWWGHQQGRGEKRGTKAEVAATSWTPKTPSSEARVVRAFLVAEGWRYGGTRGAVGAAGGRRSPPALASLVSDSYWAPWTWHSGSPQHTQGTVQRRCPQGMMPRNLGVEEASSWTHRRSDLCKRLRWRSPRGRSTTLPQTAAVRKDREGQAMHAKRRLLLCSRGSWRWTLLLWLPRARTLLRLSLATSPP
jgi:hypothetical protein